MNFSGRTSRLTVQISLLVSLLAVGVVVMLRPYIADEEQIYKQGRIDQVVSQGPVTIGHVEWKLESLKAYTTLVDDEGKPISLGAPAGAVVVVANLTATPRDGLFLKERGFSCGSTLRDDRGNSWEDQQAYGYPLPTYCSDDDHPFTMNKPAKVAQVYVVPKTAVPHLTGIVFEDFDERRRAMLTP
ncbi:hypothetical protein [Kribbella hippodromi]|uniref:hypothetical protein n=1 Tax=Kribbella hippodromi TaxID=434347 RepID=UPI0031DC2226